MIHDVISDLDIELAFLMLEAGFIPQPTSEWFPSFNAFIVKWP